MTAKEYLQQIRKADIMINNKLREVKSISDLLANISVKPSDGTGGAGGASDRIGERIAKKMDIEAEINAEIDKLVDLKRETLKMIEQLEVQKMDVLYKRYFEFKTWETISIEMGYTYQWVCKLHGRALQDFQKVCSQKVYNSRERVYKS